MNTNKTLQDKLYEIVYLSQRNNLMNKGYNIIDACTIATDIANETIEEYTEQEINEMYINMEF